jgi:carbamoyltransferase
MPPEGTRDVLICGVKASHDGGVALIDGNRLVFSVEMEKIDNNPRYSLLGDLDRVAELLRAHGVEPDDVDRYVVDGWWSETGGNPDIRTAAGGRPLILPVAPYIDGPTSREPLGRHHFTAHQFSARGGGYSSYHHASNHLVGAYCTSPFAARGEDALVLVWDGAMTPRVYYVDPRAGTIRSLGPVLPVLGNTFADFCANFEPFYSPDYKGAGKMADARQLMYHLAIAGKAMAYAALGTADEELFGAFDELLGKYSTVTRGNAFDLGAEIAQNRVALAPGRSNADLIATFQAYLGVRLVDRVSALVRRRFAGRQPNLAMGGGCALNIKWNARFRRSGAFADVWIPPFPNDAGAALGTAACEMFRETAHRHLEWDVYRGPSLGDRRAPADWSVRACDERGLAEILHTGGQPVVVLSGRAELGPRALGNRSILAPAVDPRMKDHLNAIKGRASYRPVAPICLTSRAPEIFDPGTPDPYMLFEHDIRPEWLSRIPAVAHLDGSARLQTVDPGPHSPAGRVLIEYERLSGIPVLCNTSANHSGRGFFPDVASAAEWGATKHIWSDGLLYTNPKDVPHEGGA